MRRLRAASFVSLDGVMQAPGGPEEDRTGGFAHGGWVFPFWNEELDACMEAAMGRDYDLLLGRRTYEIFAGFWPFADGAIAHAFNSAAKYVIAGPETPMTWAASDRLEGDPAEAVRTLKAGGDRDLLIQGSSEVVHAMLAADLIDELTLLTFPIILGPGKRLFDERSRPRAWSVTSSRQLSNGVAVTTLVPGGAVQTGSFADDSPRAAELARRERWSREG